MICDNRDFLSGTVAIFGDPENIFLRYVDRTDIPVFLYFFLWELNALLKKEGIEKHPRYSLMYLQEQIALTNDWHNRCMDICDKFGFKLCWSHRNRPAEDLLAQQAMQLSKEASYPSETLVFSGDGDLIPCFDQLQQWDGLIKKGKVCAIGWRANINKRIKLVTTGTAYLEHLVPRTTSLLEAVRDTQVILESP